MEEKKRNVSLDILRFISMLMIITLHYLSYSNINTNVSLLSKVGISNVILKSICNISVNCYILISGYFCLQSKFKLSKIVKLVIEVMSYSIIIYIVMILVGQCSFNIKEFACNFLPVLTRQYWFVTTYVGVYIISPFIKLISERINKTEHISIIIVGFLLFVLYYNLFFFCDNLNFGGATGIVWFTYLYFCAIYIKLYYKPEGIKKALKNYMILFFIAIMSRVPFVILYLATKKSIFLQGASIFDSVYNSIFPFLMSIAFFKVFLNLKFDKDDKEIKIIMFFSKFSWYVYLFHENKYIRSFLWNNIDFFKIVDNNMIKYFFIWISVIVVVYAVGTLVGYLVSNLLTVFVFKSNIFKKIDEFQIRMKDKYIKKIVYEKEG